MTVFRIGYVKLFFIKAIICLDTACIRIHNGLHCLFKLFCRECSVNVSVKNLSLPTGDVQCHFRQSYLFRQVQEIAVKCRDFTLCQSTCNVFLRTTACNVTCGTQAFYGSPSLCIHNNRLRCDRPRYKALYPLSQHFAPTDFYRFQSI